MKHTPGYCDKCCELIYMGNETKDEISIVMLCPFHKSAPDLLEALEDIVSLVKDSYGDCPEDDQIFHVATRAIAKAKGESNE
jgi:hypothetical protein